MELLLTCVRTTPAGECHDYESRGAAMAGYRSKKAPKTGLHFSPCAAEPVRLTVSSTSGVVMRRVSFLVRKVALTLDTTKTDSKHKLTD